MGFWKRMFGRKQVTIDMRETNDWKAGDLAVCIDDDWTSAAAQVAKPALGDVNRVTGIEDEFATYDPNVRAYFLCLEGYGSTSFQTQMFRKAVEDAEPAEAEFTLLIKRPVRKPVKA